MSTSHGGRPQALPRARPVLDLGLERLRLEGLRLNDLGLEGVRYIRLWLGSASLGQVVVDVLDDAVLEIEEARPLATGAARVGDGLVDSPALGAPPRGVRHARSLERDIG